MATNDFVRFCSEYLPQHPDLGRQLSVLPDVPSRARAMVAAGHDAGLAFSVAEAEEGLKRSEQRIREADAELSETELAAVSGGTLSMMEATQSVVDRASVLQEATQLGARKFQP